jgi:hypothetical protein
VLTPLRLCEGRLLVDGMEVITGPTADTSEDKEEDVEAGICPEVALLLGTVPDGFDERLLEAVLVANEEFAVSVLANVTLDDAEVPKADEKPLEIGVDEDGVISGTDSDAVIDSDCTGVPEARDVEPALPATGELVVASGVKLDVTFVVCVKIPLPLLPEDVAMVTTAEDNVVSLASVELGAIVELPD